MNTKDLKKFDLEAAKRGDKVVIQYNYDSDDVYPVDELVFLKSGKLVVCSRGAVIVMNPAGYHAISEYRLLMAPRLIEKWQNICRNINLRSCVMFDPAHPDKESADKGHEAYKAAVVDPRARTHYLKSTWSEEGVIQSVELIPISEDKCNDDGRYVCHGVGKPVVCSNYIEEL